jgi:hypothetical protein
LNLNNSNNNKNNSIHIYLCAYVTAWKKTTKLALVKNKQTRKDTEQSD